MADILEFPIARRRVNPRADYAELELATTFHREATEIVQHHSSTPEADSLFMFACERLDKAAALCRS